MDRILSMADIIAFNKRLRETYGVPDLQGIVLAQANRIEELETALYNKCKAALVFEEPKTTSLCKFYGVTTIKELVEAQAYHVLKLQDKLLQPINASVNYAKFPEVSARTPKTVNTSNPFEGGN